MKKGVMILDWVSLISSLGFPVVCCIAMAWYVKFQTTSYRDDVKEIQREHKDEIASVTEALNNNTLVLQKLCDKLDAENVIEGEE